jgi:hypothetical protein
MLAIVLFASGCGQPSADDIGQRLAAWSSTLQFAGEEFEAGHVPRVYVDRLLKAADEQLTTQQKQIDKLPPTEPRLVELRQRKEAVAQQAEALRDQRKSGTAP